MFQESIDGLCAINTKLKFALSSDSKLKRKELQMKDIKIELQEFQKNIKDNDHYYTSVINLAKKYVIILF